MFLMMPKVQNIYNFVVWIILEVKNVENYMEDRPKSWKKKQKKQHV